MVIKPSGFKGTNKDGKIYVGWSGAQYFVLPFACTVLTMS